VRCFPYQCLAF